ncbi:hypothetical protein D3C80_391680 [compost metagenome]
MSGGTSRSTQNTFSSEPPRNVVTLQPQPVRSVSIPARILASLSIQSTSRPVRLDARFTPVRLATSSIGAGAALIGMRSVKTLPFPGVEDSVRGSDNTRAIRSTMERPKPRPSASRMPSSRRVNSRKTSFSFCCGIPIPVSSTCNSIKSPCRRTPNRMPPLRLYLIAFETRFWMRRRSMLRSVFTTILDGTTRSLSPFLRAIGVKSVAI